MPETNTQTRPTTWTPEFIIKLLNGSQRFVNQSVSTLYKQGDLEGNNFMTSLAHFIEGTHEYVDRGPRALTDKQRNAARNYLIRNKIDRLLALALDSGKPPSPVAYQIAYPQQELEDLFD